MEPNGKIQLPAFANWTLQSDGSWLVKAIPQEFPGEQWIKIRQVSKLLRVSSRQVYTWLGVYLVYRRPSPHCIEVSLASAMELQRASNDPEFWNDRRRLDAFKKTVEKTMCKLVETALQPACRL